MPRRTRMPPRPPLVRRAVVAFPDGIGLAAIEAFRARYDPLAGALPAHVTFVFPFASSLSTLQVTTHVRRVASRWPMLPVELGGIDAFAWRWVHVRVTRGREAVVELHDRLYRRGLAPFLRTDLDYVPHVTIGRADDLEACDAMLREARATFARPIDAMLRSLAIVEVDGDGRAAVVAELPLGR
jgi:2'-5' RNA ligase